MRLCLIINVDALLRISRSHLSFAHTNFVLMNFHALMNPRFKSRTIVRLLQFLRLDLKSMFNGDPVFRDEQLFLYASPYPIVSSNEVSSSTYQFMFTLF